MWGDRVMGLATSAEEPAAGLELVLPDVAELIWGVIGLAMLVAILILLLWLARQPGRNRDRDAQVDSLARRVRELEQQAAARDRVD